MSAWNGTASVFVRMTVYGALSAAVTACAISPTELLTTSAELREQTPFTPVPMSQSWINAPDMVMVLQRGLRGESEQRVALANRVSLPGENIIIMRSRTRESDGSRLDFDQFIRWAGGLPTPFEDVDSGDLLRGSDDASTYFWIEEVVGEGATCVLGIRRLTSAQRLLPAGATSLDILMRNCVRGGLDDALAPLLDDSVSAGPVAGVHAGGSRVISPLAAPIVR